MKLARAAMRSRFEIVLADERDPGALRAAGEEALEEIARAEALLSAFRADADLFRLNAEGAHRPVRVDPLLFDLLARAGALSAALGGAFDPTVGALVRHWRGEGRPGPAGLAEARAVVGFGDQVRLDREAGTVTFARAGVRLDAGAIGKGWALARAAAILREAGVQRALLHGGTSSVVALGAPAGEGGWAVAVEHPRLPGERLASVRLRDRTLSVSTIFGRVVEREGRRAGHVIDPRHGRPVEHTWLAAATCADATEAEAISTALLVLGPPGLEVVARAFPGAGALVACPEAPGSDRLRITTLGEDFQSPPLGG